VGVRSLSRAARASRDRNQPRSHAQSQDQL